MTTPLPARSDGAWPGAERRLAAARLATATAEPASAPSPAEIEMASQARRRRRTERQIGFWLLGVVGLLVAMIMIGALTRLTEFGLSMVEWRPITGWLPPLSDQQWQAELDNYARSPQGRLVNRNITVAEFKEIYWLEYVHRLWGRLIGVAFALPLLWFWVRSAIPGWLKPRLLALLALGAMQGVLGWLMVASGLVDRPSVSHFRLAAHLLLAMAILGWMLWLAVTLLWPLQEPDWRHRDGSVAIRHWASWLIVLLTAVMAFGAFVAGLRAGVVHTTFPTMSGDWIPRGLREAADPIAYLLLDPTGVQFVHRWLAKAMGAAVLLMWWRSRRSDIAPLVRHMSNLVLAAAILQLCLGVATLLNGVPIWLGVLHQTGAVILLLGLVLALYAASPGDETVAAAPRVQPA